MEIVPHEYQNYRSFLELIRMTAIGDDLMVSVAEEIMPHFTLENIQRVAELFNNKFTFDPPEPCHVRFQRFCSYGFAPRTRFGETIMVPLHDCSKARASLFHGNNLRTPNHCMIRLCGLRLMAYGCPDCMELFSGFAEHLMSTYSRTPMGNQLDYTYSKNWMPDYKLDCLYFGTESNHGDRGIPWTLLESQCPELAFNFIY